MSEPEIVERVSPVDFEPTWERIASAPPADEPAQRRLVAAVAP